MIQSDNGCNWMLKNSIKNDSMFGFWFKHILQKMFGRQNQKSCVISWQKAIRRHLSIPIDLPVPLFFPLSDSGNISSQGRWTHPMK